jgi:hypothetical protein
MTNSYTLRAGDLVEYAGQRCRVIRVSESAAVVEVIQPKRNITPRFGKPVTIQPAPKRDRISPNSEVPILHRPSRTSDTPTTIREANSSTWGNQLVAGLGSQIPILNR